MLKYDKFIIKLFFNENNKLNKNYWKFIRRVKKNKYLNIQNYLLNRYNDLTIGSKTIFKESIYRILNGIEKRIKCPICNNYTTFNPNKKLCYNNHCSTSCEMKDKEVMEKHNYSCLKKYGSVNNSKKTKETCLKKYGVDNIAKLKIIKKKIEKTNIEKYGFKSPLQNNKIKEKTEKTNIKKYGNLFPQSNQKIKEKIKNSNIQTCIEKYNVDNIMKLKENYEKQIKTKIKNNSFTISKPEELCYQILKENFQNIKRQYKSKQYPFYCDFYIPEIDTYIEYNGFMSHGTHAYDPNNIDDQNELKKLIKLDNNHKNPGKNLYSRKINGWTIYDVKKRNIAKQNNLNYIEFWSIQDLQKWIEIIK